MKLTETLNSKNIMANMNWWWVSKIFNYQTNQIQIGIIFHFIPNRTAIINKRENNKCWS